LAAVRAEAAAALAREKAAHAPAPAPGAPVTRTHLWVCRRAVRCAQAGKRASGACLRAAQPLMGACAPH